MWELNQKYKGSMESFQIFRNWIPCFCITHVKKEAKKELKYCPECKWKHDISKFVDKAKVIARGKFITLMPILENKNFIKPMTSGHPKKLEKGEQIKYKISKRKET